MTNGERDLAAGEEMQWQLLGRSFLRLRCASRLHQRGVDMKPIADLLGHRRLHSTNIYTQVNIEALRLLAQPWPW
jgi:site-specific recombinase XerD